MERFRMGRGAFVTAAAVVTLAACSQGALTPTIPQSAATAGTAGQWITPRKSAPSSVSGPWGVGVGDMVNAEYGPPETTCSSNPSDCNGYVEQKSFQDSLSTSGSGQGGASDSASLTADVALGELKGNVSASATAGLIPPSDIVPAGASGTVNVGWEDTFLVTSKTLPPGTAVTFAAQMNVTSNPKITCNPYESGQIFATVSAAGGLSLEDECNGSIFGQAAPPVLSGEINTTVGSTFTLTGELVVYAGVEAGGGNMSGSEKTREVTSQFYLDPVTSGASYQTASGKSYKSPQEDGRVADGINASTVCRHDPRACIPPP